MLSGAAGLIYESIWTRYLGLFVGHDAYAQIIVLVIFLGGMSAGAMAVSRWTARLKEPLYGYVAIELVVGWSGRMFHAVFAATTGWADQTCSRPSGLCVCPDACSHIIGLVSCLGGMSAGAMAVSRWTARLKEPLYGYVAIELVVGCIGLIFHAVFQTTTGWAYHAVHPHLAG